MKNFREPISTHQLISRFLLENFFELINKFPGSFVLEAQCTAMQFDVDSKFVFVGDYSGSVFVLRIVGNSAQLVSKLSAHTGKFFLIAT